MVSRSRRRLLGAIGTGAALAGGGYWLSQQRGVDCPDQLESTHEFTADPNVWSPPVLDDRTLFIGAGFGITRMSSGERPFRLLALESTGEPKWVLRRELGGGFGIPKPTDDHVFVSTGANRLFALERETGRVEWTFDAGNEQIGHMSAVAVEHDGLVVISTTQPDADAFEGSTSNYVLGVSAAEGELEWSVPITGTVSSGLAVVGGTIVVVTQNGTAIGIDPETGEERWETDLDGSVDWSTTLTLLAGGVLVPREDGTLLTLAPATGEITGRYTARTARTNAEYDPNEERAHESDDGAVVRAVYRDEDALFVGDRSGGVTAYDAGGDLTEQWRYEGDVRVAALETVTDRVAVLDQRGVYAELDRETGSVHRKFLLADGWSDDRCGLDPSNDRLNGLAVTRRQIVTSGSLYSTSRYRRPSDR
ncbi:pyrrolo-quinoline quinone [Natrialba hulunbeirensis JCM 10989]|uniref:Pyrrolo-quinoline quinone n=1 Tax=Natrialba hulunbeirensis JCM 10989 TaxID=1227493 RepID=L9ZUD8_9EURY|nr:PQQ-binding-like beta-propeller repeat protein [Natrialba hulunbeirensis]ELY89197.1 pyrrolo-quinoline quinone [Natrialba hulunbeirensis JCM 10989]